MKKIIFTKAIFILLLLSSMVWSGYRYEAAIMQSCGGSITTSNAYFYISSGTDYSNFFTGGTKVSDFTDGERPGYYVFLLKSDNSSISLNAQTDGLHKFLGWKVVSGASNCSFTDASKASTTLKIKGKCAIKAYRALTALTLNAGTGGTVRSESNCTTGISVYEEKISNRHEPSPYDLTSNTYLNCTEILKATPSAGYRFDKWTITSGSSNCGIYYSSEAQAYANIKGSCTIKGSFVKTAVLTIGTATGGTTSPTGSQTVDVGSRVKITAIPDETHVFTSWSKATNCPVDDNRSATTYVTVNGDCTIKPAFLKFAELTITAGTGGTTTETSKRTYVSGSAEVSVTATPKSGYRFNKWVKVSGGNACYVLDETAATTDVHVRENCKIQATFVRTYELKLFAGTGGSTNFTSKTVDAGSKVDILASINQYGYRFDKWTSSSTSCTVADPASSYTTVTVNGACTVTANFVQRNTFAIGPNPADGGTTSPYGYKTVDKGSSNSITATPKSGYRFDRWGSSSTSCLINNAASASTTVKVSGDCSITANFIKTYNVTVAAGTGGSVSSSGTRTVDNNATINLRATADAGYRFDKWTSTSSSCPVASPTSLSTTVTVGADCSVKANFIKTHNVLVYMLHYNNNITLFSSGSLYKTLNPDEGSTIQLPIKEHDGYDFEKWVFVDSHNLSGTPAPEYDCKIETPNSESSKLLVNGECAVAARLIKRININVSALAGGKVSPAGDNVGHPSVPFSIRATPDSGYAFVQWTSSNPYYCKLSSATSANTTLTPSSDNCSVQAQFIKRVNINVSASAGGKVSPAGDNIVNAFTSIDIHATPDSGYAFVKWTSSPSSCKLSSITSANATLTPGSDNCFVQAQFIRRVRVIVDSVDNVDIAPRDEIVDVGTKINYRNYRPSHDWQLSHFEHKSGKENCPVTLSENGYDITINGDCELQPVVVPYFELTGDFKTYYHYYNGEYRTVNVRFHAATEDSTWYYVEMASSIDHSGIFENYGDDMWTQNPVSTCTGNMDGLGCYFKSVNTDNYMTVSTETLAAYPFSVRYSKVPTDYVDVEYDLAGKIIQRPTIDVGHGMNAQIEAEDLTGYVFKEWKLMEGDCEVDSSTHKNAHVKFSSSRCRYHGVYEADSAANVGIGLISIGYYNSVQCYYVSVADSTKPQTFFAWRPKQISYTRLSDITMTYDGDTLQLYAVGDTIWVPIVNEFLREYEGTDSLPVVVERPSEQFYMGVVACEVLPDGIMNGSEHTIAVYTDYAGKTLSWEQSGPELMYHDPDAPDIIKLSDMETGSDSIVRTTEKVKIEVQTQDFSDDTWIYDQYLIDFPATILSTLPVKVSCVFSEDEETLDLTHAGGGVYSLSNLAKSEGKAVKGDSMLTCATDDMIVTEFVDPFYKTVTRDTVTFGDVVPLEYVFLEDDLVRDIDSVETTEVSFGFSLNMVSPTYDKVDTIIVALFTDLGDTLWVPAFETDVYSGVFEGRSSFRFVTSKKDQKDDLLDAVMNLDADTNRAVIRMQIGKDKSALDSRDSIVVFYGFIPADSAEIQDQDKDGQADFVRVHFAKSILQEQLKVDTLFWGGAEDIGRGVAERDMDISAEGDWIDVTLESPFGYGVTGVDSTGKKFVSISRNTSSAIQKVYLSDKVGPVPVRAVKRPGLKKEEDFLNDVDVLPLDTLVVTMSEPVEKTFGKNKKAWSKLFQYSEECGSGKVRPVKLKEEPRLDKSGRVWTMVLPRETDARAGYCLMTNPAASIADEYGNAPGIGGVVIEGEDSQIYLYSIKPYPAISLDTLSAIRTETQMAYRASVSVFDNIGNVMAQFRTEFGKNGELEDDDLANPENSTHFGYIEWDQRTKRGRLAGTGVYIWKIKFLFDDGHKETRTVRTGIRRR